MPEFQVARDQLISVQGSYDAWVAQAFGERATKLPNNDYTKPFFDVSQGLVELRTASVDLAKRVDKLKKNSPEAADQLRKDISAAQKRTAQLQLSYAQAVAAIQQVDMTTIASDLSGKLAEGEITNEEFLAAIGQASKTIDINTTLTNSGLYAVLTQELTEVGASFTKIFQDMSKLHPIGPREFAKESLENMGKLPDTPEKTAMIQAFETLIEYLELERSPQKKDREKEGTLKGARLLLQRIGRKKAGEVSSTNSKPDEISIPEKHAGLWMKIRGKLKLIDSYKDILPLLHKTNSLDLLSPRNGDLLIVLATHASGIYTQPIEGKKLSPSLKPRQEANVGSEAAEALKAKLTGDNALTAREAGFILLKLIKNKAFESWFVSSSADDQPTSPSTPSVEAPHQPIVVDNVLPKAPETSPLQQQTANVKAALAEAAKYTPEENQVYISTSTDMGAFVATGFAIVVGVVNSTIPKRVLSVKDLAQPIRALYLCAINDDAYNKLSEEDKSIFGQLELRQLITKLES